MIIQVIGGFVKRWISVSAVEEKTMTIVRTSVAIAMLVILVGGVLGVIWYTWQDMTGGLAIRRLEAEASKAAAEADLAAANADLTLAGAIRAPAEAAAWAVRAQSTLMLYWGLLTPFGIVFTLLSVGVGAFAMGAACVGIGLLIMVQRRERDG